MSYNILDFESLLISRLIIDNQKGSLKNKFMTYQLKLQSLNRILFTLFLLIQFAITPAFQEIHISASILQALSILGALLSIQVQIQAKDLCKIGLYLQTATQIIQILLILLFIIYKFGQLSFGLDMFGIEQNLSNPTLIEQYIKSDDLRNHTILLKSFVAYISIEFLISSSRLRMFLQFIEILQIFQAQSIFLNQRQEIFIISLILIQSILSTQFNQTYSHEVCREQLNRTAYSQETFHDLRNKASSLENAIVEFQGFMIEQTGMQEMNRNQLSEHKSNLKSVKQSGEICKYLLHQLTRIQTQELIFNQIYQLKLEEYDVGELFTAINQMLGYAFIDRTLTIDACVNPNTLVKISCDFKLLFYISNLIVNHLQEQGARVINLDWDNIEKTPPFNQEYVRMSFNFDVNQIDNSALYDNLVLNTIMKFMINSSIMNQIIIDNHSVYFEFYNGMECNELVKPDEVQTAQIDYNNRMSSMQSEIKNSRLNDSSKLSQNHSALHSIMSNRKKTPNIQTSLNYNTMNPQDNPELMMDMMNGDILIDENGNLLIPKQKEQEGGQDGEKSMTAGNAEMMDINVAKNIKELDKREIDGMQKGNSMIKNIDVNEIPFEDIEIEDIKPGKQFSLNDNHSNIKNRYDSGNINNEDDKIMTEGELRKKSTLNQLIEKKCSLLNNEIVMGEGNKILQHNNEKKQSSVNEKKQSSVNEKKQSSVNDKKQSSVNEKKQSSVNDKKQSSFNDKNSLVKDIIENQDEQLYIEKINENDVQFNMEKDQSEIDETNILNMDDVLINNINNITEIKETDNNSNDKKKENVNDTNKVTNKITNKISYNNNFFSDINEQDQQSNNQKSPTIKSNLSNTTRTESTKIEPSLSIRKTTQGNNDSKKKLSSVKEEDPLPVDKISLVKNKSTKSMKISTPITNESQLIWVNVDDEKCIHTMNKKLFKKFDITLECTKTGDETIQMLIDISDKVSPGSTPKVCIVTDQKLEQELGDQVLQRCMDLIQNKQDIVLDKQLSNSLEVIQYGLSSTEDISVHKKFEDLGAKLYQKPLKKDQVQDMINLSAQYFKL